MPPVDNLRRKKRIALALLAGAFLLFVVASVMGQLAPHWGWRALLAFSEAAMVGGLADWFAVVALFRRPMGLPIPHTGIIPAKKDRIGEALADFVRDHFLARDQVVDKIRAFGPAGWLARKLATRATGEALAGFVLRIAPGLLDELDGDALRQRLRAALVEHGRKVDVSSLAAGIIGYLGRDAEQQQEALNALLRVVAEELRKPALRESLAGKVSEELGAFARSLLLDRLVAEPVAARIANGALAQVDEILTQPEHPVRQRVAEHVQALARDLREDPRLRAELERSRDQLLASDELAGYSRALWDDLLAWLRHDLADDRSAIHRQARSAVRGLGGWLSSRDDLRRTLDAWCIAAAGPLVDRYRESARDYIVDRVRQWSADEMTGQIELGIGSDLQYIRYNGTVIGGVIGLLLFGLMVGIQRVMQAAG